MPSHSPGMLPRGVHPGEGPSALAQSRPRAVPERSTLATKSGAVVGKLAAAECPRAFRKAIHRTAGMVASHAHAAPAAANLE